MFQSATIDQILEDLRRGRMVVVVDDETRENEGDLVCAAEFVTADTINFMATHARGLICLPVDSATADRLHLTPMTARNTDTHTTAFTVSIDHVDSTTGISAAERAHTARAVANADSTPETFRRPGHLFPLLAAEHGVLVRDGHTEATVDLLRLAGLAPCGICCEIMDSDGSMMRRDALAAFAAQHQLNCITIQDIQLYRQRTEQLVTRIADTTLPTRYGHFRMYGYADTIHGTEHIALVMDDVPSDEPFLCRVHSACLTGDALGSLRCDCGKQYDTALRQIAAAGRGALLYLAQEGRGIGLLNKLRAYALQDEGLDTVEANRALGFADDARDYAVAAQILQDLGHSCVQVMTNNPDKITQLERYGIRVAARLPLQMPASPNDLVYLRTKQEKMGHITDYS